MIIVLIPVGIARLLPEAARRFGLVISIVIAVIAYTPVHNGLFQYLLNHQWEMVKGNALVRFFFINTVHSGRRAIGFHHAMLGPDEARCVDDGELFWEEGL